MRKRVIYFIISISFILSSCMSGLEPLPSEVGDLDLSLSIPVAKSVVGLDKTYHIGPPDWFLTQNVPDWAKYQYLYYSDTVTVDLYKIYEKSNEIRLLEFNINIWNEFPVKGVLDISFIDNVGTEIYAFNPIPLIEGDIFFGEVIRAGYSNSKARFDKTLIENLRTANRIVYYLKINLKDANTNTFQYFDDFKMKCHIGARVDFTLKEI